MLDFSHFACFNKKNLGDMTTDASCFSHRLLGWKSGNSRDRVPAFPEQLSSLTKGGDGSQLGMGFPHFLPSRGSQGLHTASCPEV